MGAPFAGTGLQGGEPRAGGAKQALHLNCVQYVRHMASVVCTYTDQSVSEEEVRCSFCHLLEVSVNVRSRTLQIISRKDTGKLFMVVSTFVDWLEFGVNAWRVGFVADSFLLARDQTRVVDNVSSCRTPVVSGVFFVSANDLGGVGFQVLGSYRVCNMVVTYVNWLAKLEMSGWKVQMSE